MCSGEVPQISMWTVNDFGKDGQHLFEGLWFMVALLKVIRVTQHMSVRTMKADLSAMDTKRKEIEKYNKKVQAPRK
jgi:hypothetical protein